MQSTWRSLGWFVMAGAACLASAGCMEPQTSAPARPTSAFSGGYRTQILPTSDYQAAFAAAQGVVVDFFQVATADPVQGLITFEPTEYSRIGGARMRRTGLLALHKVGSSIVASIKIEIQKDATPTMRAMRDLSAPDDRPGTTPIQGEAGLTPSQQQYWDTLRRDSKMEADILQRISDALGQVSGTTQPTEDTTSQTPGTTPPPVSPLAPAQ